MNAGTLPKTLDPSPFPPYSPMPIGWSGENVRLVPLDYERHYENCYRWINDPEVSEWLAVGDEPIGRLGSS